MPVRQRESAMTTEVEPFTVEFTDEEHETGCCHCDKVAVRVAIIADTKCQHPHPLCQEHTEITRENERDISNPWWACVFCDSIGVGPLRWEMP